MASIGTERVLAVHHWNEKVFSFKTTRDPAFRFENGHFVMLGMPVGGKPLMRAYSIASANHEEALEFLSIKVPDGPLTSRLQNIKPGDEICVSRKPTGTLLLRDLKPGKHVYLLSSGTGLAPFMSLIKDPELYERFEKVILVHAVRYRSELAYRDYIEWELTHHEYLGEQVRNQLIYVPTVTRQRFRHEGRITTLIETGKLFESIGLPPLDPAVDRAMICGSPAMLTELSALLVSRGFQPSHMSATRATSSSSDPSSSVDPSAPAAPARHSNPGGSRDRFPRKNTQIFMDALTKYFGSEFDGRTVERL